MIKQNKDNGTFEVSFYRRHPVTKVPIRAARKGIKTQAQAQRVLAELVIQVQRKIDATPTGNNPEAWGAFLPVFFEACRERGLTAKTIHDYQTCLEAYTLERWGDRQLPSITADEIRGLVNSLIGKSPSHRQNLLKFIRSVFQLAWEKGLITRNPAPKMKFQQGLKLKQVLTEEQAKQMLGYAFAECNEWAPHYFVALHTGMRNGELFALTWDRVNFETRQIKVDCSWNNKDGFKSTKSGDDRIVPISDELLPFLKELRLKSAESHFVLPRIDKWEKGEQARDLRMFLIGHGLPAIRFHDLRATWATLLLSKGIPAVQVMTMGGWKDYKTMVIYLRKAGVDTKGATNVINLHDTTAVRGQVIEMTSRSKL